jgi:predicted 2-oxoglutarate/Fe(II)-dependent dioxygenase YbiX
MQPAATVMPERIAGFLSATQCREVVAEIDASHQAQAEIWGDDGFGVHPDSRRGTIAQLSPATEDLLQDRLWEVMPRLEAHFGCEVTHLSGVTALIYREHDHFAAHSDGGGDDEAPAEVRRRRVSLVIALNDGSGEQREFSGGELEFYAGSIPEVATQAPPLLRVRSEPGLLIAFGSSMVHRVVPVIAGRRYSLAVWALADQRQSA